MTDPRQNYKRYGYLTGGLLFCFGLYWLFVLRHQAYTDDAYVQGNQVMITPLQSGFVKSILTDDTFLVQKGQLLVELDETDAKIALDRAKELLGLKVREVCQSFHQLFSLEAEKQAKKAEFIKAAQDYEHRLSVVEAGGVSVEDFEHAIAALKTSFFSLEKIEIEWRKALAFINGTSITTHPDVMAAADLVRQAWVNLYRTKIYSPVEGLVAQRSIQVGMWVGSGSPLMAVIPLDQIWVNANFKETQMKRMRIGQTVSLKSDLYGHSVSFEGEIVGLPGGAGNAFSLLPPQNLSGNWIKIVQRLPVRIEIKKEALVRHPLRIGLSMEVRADLKKQNGPLVPYSSKGAPTYKTNIYEGEEMGDFSWIEEICQMNSDPYLKEYYKTPFSLANRCL